MTRAERFEGCILGGAIGDAWGSAFENQFKEEEDTYYLFGNPFVKPPVWEITDDTQLTLATIRAMINDEGVNPESIAQAFLASYQRRKLRGLGASTLKALRELAVGGHWSQVGRRGEYAAGNGAAMRIAPLAFYDQISNNLIRDVCSITHHNDEAYIGARCIVIAIRAILNGEWDGSANLIALLIGQIPDTRVRDRLIAIKDIKDLESIGRMGNDGYVVNSVPLAIAAANQVKILGIEAMYNALIKIGGDTDTNASMAGQIAGALVGKKGIPTSLIEKLSALYEYDDIQNTIHTFTANMST